jgi:hypothetical protein
VLAHYGFDVPTLRKLPIVTFWMLNKAIDRMAAERDLRAARLMVQTQSEEGLTKLLADLQQQLGKIVVFDEGKLAMQMKRDKITEDLRAELNAIGDMSNVRSR